MEKALLMAALFLFLSGILKLVLALVIRHREKGGAE